MKKTITFRYHCFCCVYWFEHNHTMLKQVDLYLDEINVYVSDIWENSNIYSLPDTIRQIYKAALLVGTGPNTVFDY